ncbi:unnamed protein product [Didymodactylos carnosus]|uniref:Cation efflux protein cytoplasmic domain-containing protein n=1 Tax=Didymodactylos carnosus TaxID=1234261 RepID=A0A815MXX1_9BILA|nr:unnamed protein product [Didymodactylos carnosus]CAF1429094.1 unnamed protein product [Didymodactylos carnosus]CAF4080426.1 unnamed protein product [Didymodactylos carnosus]CAF4308475.1 unnamed protein product [Didymodactylos carnosus]
MQILFQIQFTYTPRHTYGLARVGVVGELIAFISFCSLSVSVFMESIKHVIDIIFVLPRREYNSTIFTAHGHGKYVVLKRHARINTQVRMRRNSLKSLPEKLSKALLITDTLPVGHSLLQVLNMLLGPFVILISGLLLIIFFEKPNYDEKRRIYSRLISGISSIHELHIWRLTPQKTLATIHIVFDTTEGIQTKYKEISLLFQALSIDHVTIQPEFSLTPNDSEKVDCLYQCSNQDLCGSLQCCKYLTNEKEKVQGEDAQLLHSRPHDTFLEKTDDVNDDGKLNRKQLVPEHESQTFASNNIVRT